MAADDGPASVVAAAREAFGRIDVLHNNVGIGAGDGPPHHLADEAYDRIMDVNLRAMWRTCREAVPALRETQGAIVNVSSLAAIASAGNLTAYKLSKAGVNALTQNLAAHQRQARRPGERDHARLHRHPDGRRRTGRGDGHEPGRLREVRADHVPLGRQGTAWDVAHAALFLASDEAQFITGVALAVDGGQSTLVG